MEDAGTYLDSRKVISIAAGEAHTLALTGDGSVYSWGRTFGRLGTGSELDRLFSAKIKFNSTDRSEKVKVVRVSAGYYHSLALSGFHGIIPTEGSITKNETRLKISSIKAGGMMSLAVDDLGSLWIWGNCPPQDVPNKGEGFTLLTTYAPTPVWDFHGQTVVKVACGNEHIVFLNGLEIYSSAHLNKLL